MARWRASTPWWTEEGPDSKHEEVDWLFLFTAVERVYNHLVFVCVLIWRKYEAEKNGEEKRDIM